MASKAPNEPPPRPDIGDTLLVIHDFQARSSDELSLSKGDRVELLERDDEFGDGWFLGRHLVNENTGLFPEVYTRPAPRNVPSLNPPKPLNSRPESQNEPTITGVADAPPSASTPVAETPLATAPPLVVDAPVALPLNTVKSEPTASPSITTNSSPGPTVESSQSQTPNQDSQVLNETLNVINEHITDLRGSPSRGALRVPHGTNDSGSEYSVPLDQRMSYIQGEETDEEEDRNHTRSEVSGWSADAVAEYLFAAGVEKQHCEVFRDQDITGEVLLGMDQSSLFIKAFDLGSVGRRLKTWHKIKSLQDEVVSNDASTRRTTQTYASEIGSEDAKGSRSRTNTATTSISNRPISSSARRFSSSQPILASPTALKTPVSPSSAQDSPTRPGHVKRPSAASVRDLHHSRRHSSTDYRMPAPPIPGITPPALTPNGSMTPSSFAAHKKQASFDRNWTLGSAFSQPPSARPQSSAGFQDILAASDPDLQDSAVDLDRGYFSGTETEARKRNVLRKKDGTGHSRQSSYAEEQRVRSATALSRHSRFGSVDSFRDSALSPAVQKYYAMQGVAHRRTASTNTTESVRPIPPAKDTPPAPIVTRIDTGLNPGSRSQVSPPSAKSGGFNTDWFSSVVNKPMGKGRPGMRAISDKLSGNRSKDLPTPDLALDSPARTTSDTASADQSLDMESPGTGKTFNSMPPGGRNNKKKSKKETSAYTRGLQKISPFEAKQDADYCGWMKKKSSNLMTTWKPRFFVLKGRRLAYYYSEDDDQEKGLIDISFHRVLPADNEKLTGLHATITGAVGGANMPVNGGETGSNEQVFIFKLMPPRAGLSRAVNFTKPTVHYFAVPNLQQGRLWMAALMKATIDRDDTQPITTTYQQKTISLNKAKQMRHRPPALMNLEEAAEDEHQADGEDNKPSNGLGIFGEADSGVSGMDKLAAVNGDVSNGVAAEPPASIKSNSMPPQSA